MTNHIANRDRVIEALRQELVGPSPQGKEIDCAETLTFEDVTTSYGPWRQLNSGEEILLRDSPTKRYGIGVLYPIGTGIDSDETVLLASETPTGAEANDEEKTVTDNAGAVLSDEVEEQIEDLKKQVEGAKDTESDDFDLSTANAYKPSSMAVSFLASFPERSQLIIEASGGRYIAKDVQVAGEQRVWWLRQPVKITGRFDGQSLLSADDEMVAANEPPEITNGEGLDLQIEVFARKYASSGNCLLTVCLINRTKSATSSNAVSLFQSRFTASITQGDQHCATILPYPQALIKEPTSSDPEEESLHLLYRDSQTFAVGHGCAADWGVSGKEAIWVSAEALPQFETPSISSDVKRKDKTLVEVPMAKLAGLVPGDNGITALIELVDLYKKWIHDKEREIQSLEPDLQSIAETHIQACKKCADRMTDGISYLQTDKQAFEAFQLANRAMLLQQVRGRRESRRAVYESKTRRIIFDESYQPADKIDILPGRGNWRAFQIAFLLMSIRSAAESDVIDRGTVELIWFPTGGGKTEAYLGLAAFAIFIRRLRTPSDAGVHALMRYTLRLLTAQQFQRASSLICAMEYLRMQDEQRLGTHRISIGIWLGYSTTPNSREQARESLTKLKSGSRYAENKFLLSRCPWCRAQLGPVDYPNGKPKYAPRVIGYELTGETVSFRCPDSDCIFEAGLPVYVVDDDIYDFRPSLVIGTVDKFAMLAWRPEARSLFGINTDGVRDASPPGLIIQDELHLISGPLGSLVGLYETVIEDLCTDKRAVPNVPPKIVSSTATIRRYAEQIKALYARSEVSLFPPPGLEAGDSFFAKYARDQADALCSGRIYVGVHAPGLGSLQTAQVRTFTSLLQAPVKFVPEERDPWWTLLLFFNSLRELGTTLSLFQSDIPNYFGVIQQRNGIAPSQLRRFYNLQELTGRLRSDEVPTAISALEVTTTSVGNEPIDVCLASNIIEVGVDIDRLSLMAVVGQPKTTSQYIQVTGRIGRLWEQRPGLAVTIYTASKPRDRSHFEKFRSYHERLYAQVEPTSVTPFSAPVLDRALHAILAAYARQVGDREVAASPYPYPASLIDKLREIILPRVAMVDAAEVANCEKIFDERAKEWKRWERTRWSGSFQSEDMPLLREAGEYVDRGAAKLSWSTPMSMRNVDAECQVEISQLFVTEEEGSA